VFGLMGVHPGSLGAVNFDAAPVLVDAVPQERTNMVTGANRDGSTWVASMSRATCCPQRRRGWQISAPQRPVTCVTG